MEVISIQLEPALMIKEKKLGLRDLENVLYAELTEILVPIDSTVASGKAFETHSRTPSAGFSERSHPGMNHTTAAITAIVIFPPCFADRALPKGPAALFILNGHVPFRYLTSIRA